MSDVKKGKYYELHITLLGAVSVVREMVEEIGWKFSSIEDDPVLGKGVRCYATTHLPLLNKWVGGRTAQEELVEGERLLKERIAQGAAAGGGGIGSEVGAVRIVRSKIELVVFDVVYY